MFDENNIKDLIITDKKTLKFDDSKTLKFMERVKPEFCNIYLTTGDKNLQFDKTELFKKF